MAITDLEKLKQLQRSNDWSHEFRPLCGTDEDAEFIAAARNALLALVRRVERYEKALKEIDVFRPSADSSDPYVQMAVRCKQIAREALKEETDSVG